MDLLQALEEHSPIKREVEIDGWPKGLFLWRMTAEEIVKVASMPTLGADNLVEYQLYLCGVGAGDELRAGVFASDAGKDWLRRHPELMVKLAQAVMEFNELRAVSPERKKKSETTINYEDSSGSAPSLALHTLDD